jgi:hypothetical protein
MQFLGFNNQMSRFLMFGLLVSFSVSCSAQKKERKPRPVVIQAPSVDAIFENFNYIPEIKSVEFFSQGQDQSFPVMFLGSADRMILQFDDLRSGSRNLSYSVTHCDVNWKPSNISSLDYLESFSQDLVTNYRSAYNTFQKYTHYQLTIPNLTVIPKLSGNYLLKVYENSDPTRLLLTRRFYVVQPKVVLQAQIAQSNQVNNRDQNQKVNFSILHPSLNIQNAYQEITAVVMQNGRTDVSEQSKRPLFIRNNQLVYTDNNTFDFAAGNEFRRFDTRSFRFKSDGVYENIKDSLYTVNLFADISKNIANYSSQLDNNGNFFILNQDGSNPDYDGDYANVSFALKATPPSANGSVYVLGAFNSYQKKSEYKMTYNAAQKIFTLNTLVKQGVTDYHYVWTDANGKTIGEHEFDGSFYQTENSYQILIYYRSPSSRFDELVAFAELNTVRLPRNY